jgi:hypothetical protein
MLYLCGEVRVVVVWVECGVGCEGRGIMKNITYENITYFYLYLYPSGNNSYLEKLFWRNLIAKSYQSTGIPNSHPPSTETKAAWDSSIISL